jgi:hypothetical protein
MQIFFAVRDFVQIIHSVHTTTDKRKEIYLNAFYVINYTSSPTIGCVIFENILIINVKISS